MADKKIKLVSEMTKKERKAYYASQRGSWNGLNPVTRVPANPKAYNRAKQATQTRRDVTY